ncbi:spermine oxidase-like [Phymastichus coffea]|uniref:spermine oxidase-like n=1 Tax=Phymastichus coffea TaxID=108790 RepID=UPI00273C5153|nr:spermine oxidase-like [Phymastichus coffea]
MSHSGKDKKIIIVGAGPAGIAAASKLFESGFKNVKILEAEDRIGGRVFTTEFGNYSVDLGGQWVHGEKSNVAFELAYPLGLLEKQDDCDAKHGLIFLDSKGNDLKNDVDEKIRIFFDKHMSGEVFDENAPYKSIGEYIEQKFEEEFQNDSEILYDKSKYLHHFEVNILGGKPAKTWRDISLINHEAFKDCEGDNRINWKTKGYSTILDILMKRYPNRENELPVIWNTDLNSEVISIDYFDNFEGSLVMITTAKGKIYKANHVIVTIPLGVLKEKHKLLFIPPLPENKAKSIEALGFGNAGKVYLLYDKPFWQLGDKTSMHYAFMWNDAERKAIEAEPEKMWMLGTPGAVTVEHKPNLLELYIAGEYAKVMEQVAEDKVFAQAQELIKQFMGKKFDVTKPISMLRTQWQMNPHFRGTISYRSVETESRKVYPNALEEPITLDNLKILFAGEATSQHRYATVDGAITSGWKAADRLINFYENLSYNK